MKGKIHPVAPACEQERNVIRVEYSPRNTFCRDLRFSERSERKCSERKRVSREACRKFRGGDD